MSRNRIATIRTGLGLSLVTLASQLFCSSTTASAEDWKGFLGSTGNAVVPAGNVPVEFTIAKDGQPAKNVAWRAPIAGRAVCGPIVVGNRVFATSSSGIEQRWLDVVCFDLKDGKELWKRKSKATGRPYGHPTSANVAPTPCSDGERVFAFFSSNDLVCYDLDGNLQWFRGLAYDHPKAGNDVGMSSSPVVVNGVVVVQSEAQAEAFAAGIDAKTGVTLWEVSRLRRANWASPCVALGADGQAVVVLQSSQDLVGLDPRSGSQVWKVDNKCSSVPTSVFASGKLFVPGQSLKVFDLPKAFDPPVLQWESNRVAPGNSSTLVRKDEVISCKGSVLASVDMQGKNRWQIRLGETGSIWSTPVIVGDKLIVFTQSGKCVTVDLSGEEAKVIATSDLGEEVLGSPAVAGDAIIVRSVQAIWKLAKQ